MINDLYTRPLALVVIGALAVTIVFLVRHIIKLYTRLDDLQEKRVDEAKTVLDKVSEPMRKVAEQQEEIKKQNNTLHELFIQYFTKRGA